jgi:pyridoxamine 5'-phosphate oxidase
MPDFDKLREEYKHAALDESDVSPDMYVQFDRWFHQAVQSGLREPNAMTLATASPDGVPSARIVLLKGVDPDGFTFYTNYASAKARELGANPRAALVFYWNELERQVRIQGTVTKVARQESAQYFNSRPLLSRLGAIASPQSEVIEDRKWLERRMAEARERFQEEGRAEPECPEHWGGYRLWPEVAEFWQGRHSRLHDRIRYKRAEPAGWRIERLAP